MRIGRLRNFFRARFWINEFPAHHVTREKPRAYRLRLTFCCIEKCKFRGIVGPEFMIGNSLGGAENLALILIANFDQGARFGAFLLTYDVGTWLEDQPGKLQGFLAGESGLL